MTIVGDIATRRLVRCTPEATLRDIAETLVEERVHAVFVIDEAGLPVGVVSDLDLLAGEWLAGDEATLDTMRSITASDVMTSPVETVDVQVDIRDAARRLRDLRIHRLLVTEAGRPIGVVSVADLVAELGRTEGEDRKAVRDVMSPAFVTSGPQTSIAAAARAMTERRSRSIVVVDDGCRPLGVITGDHLLAALEGGDDARSRPIRELVPERVPTIAPDASLREAADRMLEHEVHRLVVLEDGASMPLGILSTSDIVVEMARPGSRWETRIPTMRGEPST